MTVTLTTIRYYTQADPYHYTVDNRPLQDLESRDNQILALTKVMDITGSATPTIATGPVGWTCTSSGAGVYTITHDMGDTSFIALGTVVDASGGIFSVTSITSTQINIKTTNLAGTATHLRFFLHVKRY